MSKFWVIVVMVLVGLALGVALAVTITLLFNTDPTITGSICGIIGALAGLAIGEIIKSKE